MEHLAQCRVAVFGVGGVGGYTVEALARSGVGALDLIDDDKVCLTNLNRQIYATRSTVGKYKVDVAEERIKDINPDCKVTTYKTFYLPETQDQFDFTQYDYVVDAIDTVKGKLALVEQAKAAGTPIICAMGAGNKLDPTAFKVADIYNRMPEETHQAPEGCLFHRKAGQAAGGSVHQLPETLHLSSGYPEVYSAQGHPGFHRVCSCGCGIDHRR